jgi:transglutaminase superfamily protein
MPTVFDYFAAHGPMTHPGGHTDLLDTLPVDIPALCRVVQGLMIHVFWAEQYDVLLFEERKAELQLRSVASKLDRLLAPDAHPLAQARPPAKRLVGNCRDFSVLLTAMLRHHGVPARARCGFGRYFMPNHYEDHWVCEYWNIEQHRWVLVDAQLDALQCAKLAIPFDPLDVSRDQFIVGGQAWQLCRSKQADPMTFGIFDMQGLWFVRGNFVRDVAALNKIELLPWDSWGVIEARDEDLSADDLAFLDQLAELTCDDVPAFDSVRAWYESDDRVRVPATIHSYTQQGIQTIEPAAVA